MLDRSNARLDAVLDRPGTVGVRENIGPDGSGGLDSVVALATVAATGGTGGAGGALTGTSTGEVGGISAPVETTAILFLSGINGKAATGPT